MLDNNHAELLPFCLVINPVNVALRWWPAAEPNSTVICVIIRLTLYGRAALGCLELYLKQWWGNLWVLQSMANNHPGSSAGRLDSQVELDYLIRSFTICLGGYWALEPAAGQMFQVGTA